MEHGNRINCLDFAPNNRNFVSCANDTSIRYYDITEVSSKAAISILAGHSDNVKKVKILDDFRVISASSDKTVKIWDLRKTAEPTCRFVVENPIEDFCLAKG